MIPRGRASTHDASSMIADIPAVMLPWQKQLRSRQYDPDWVSDLPFAECGDVVGFSEGHAR